MKTILAIAIIYIALGCATRAAVFNPAPTQTESRIIGKFEIIRNDKDPWTLPDVPGQSRAAIRPYSITLDLGEGLVMSADGVTDFLLAKNGEIIFTHSPGAYHILTVLLGLNSYLAVRIDLRRSKSPYGLTLQADSGVNTYTDNTH